MKFTNLIARLALSGAAFGLASASYGLAPQTAERSAESTSLDADLETFADFFVPADGLRDTVIGGCEVGYRTKLDKEKQVDQAIPGIHDRMIQTASRYCRTQFETWLTAMRAKVKDHWRTEVSSADIHRLALLFQKPAQEVKAFHVEVKPGETVTSAVRRADTRSSADTGDFEQKQKVFAAKPGGAALLNKVAAYQTTMQAELEGTSGPVKIVLEGIKAAKAAANAYAVEKGFQPVYP